jgi:hypothetical protein
MSNGYEWEAVEAVPDRVRGSREKKAEPTVKGFLESGFPAAEVKIGERGKGGVILGLRRAIKSLGVEDQVIATQRKGAVYLIRK